MAKKSGNAIGAWAFFIGVVLALLAGILSALNIVSLADTSVMSILVILGILVGLFNVTSKESTTFLLSGTVLIIASTFGMGVMVMVPLLSAILMALLAIFVPAVIVVAIKSVFAIAKD